MEAKGPSTLDETSSMAITKAMPEEDHMKAMQEGGVTTRNIVVGCTISEAVHLKSLMGHILIAV
jgi:hypothetical protein